MRTYDAEVVLVDGLIDDAGRIAAEYARERGAFNVATFREPYRVEGKKTMGYELVERLGARTRHDRLSNRRRHRAGRRCGRRSRSSSGSAGSTRERPVMVAVQAEGCAPIVRAFARGEETAARVEGGTTKMWGLRVPGGIGDRLTLRALARIARTRARGLRRSGRWSDARPPSPRRHRRHRGRRRDARRAAQLANEPIRASRSDRALQYRNLVEVRAARERAGRSRKLAERTSC